MVEHWTENPCVRGSNPFFYEGFKKKEIKMTNNEKLNNLNLYLYISNIVLYFTFSSSFIYFSKIKNKLIKARKLCERFFKNPIRYILLLPVNLQKTQYSNPNLSYYKSKRFFFLFLNRYWFTLNYIHLLNNFEQRLLLDFWELLFVYWKYAEINKSYYHLFDYDFMEVWRKPTNKYFLTHIPLIHFFNKDIEKLNIFYNLNIFNLEYLNFVIEINKKSINFDTSIDFLMTQLFTIRKRKRNAYRYDKHKYLKLELREERERLRKIRIEEELKEKERKQKEKLLKLNKVLKEGSDPKV